MYCAKCGNQLNDGVKFCPQCGTAVAAPSASAEPALPAVQKNEAILQFDNGDQSFPFLDSTLFVSRELNAFNYYRKAFHKLARIKADDLKREYLQSIRDLDAFLTEFPQLYTRHLSPILDAAQKLIIAHGVYDLSLDQLTAQHTADFCLCQEDIDAMIDSFNQTIEANQDRKIRTYNMMPGIVFRGLGGFATALAMNVAVNAIAKADIARANVSPRQRAELFARINVDNLMERAFVDYWRVFLSLTWQLKEHGAALWYPTDENNQRALGMYQNLVSGMIPNEKKPELLIEILQANPYLDGLMDYLAHNYPFHNNVKVVRDFFSTD